MKKAAVFLIIMIFLLAGCSQGDRLVQPFYASEIDTNNITLGGSPLLIPAYGEIYQTAFETIVCTVANDWYPIHGPTTTGSINGFRDDGAGRLTYTDITPNRICLVTSSLTVSLPVGQGPAILSCGLFKNSTLDVESVVGDYMTTADAAESLPITCLVQLDSTGDYLDLYLSSNTGNVSVVINTMTLVATTVD